MKVPPIYDTLTHNEWRLKKYTAPFFLPLIILIGLIIYRLANSNNMSDDEKKKLSYAEIALASVGSFSVLVFFGIVVILSLVVIILMFVGIKEFTSKVLFVLPFFVITLIILNPVSLTALRMILHDKLTEQQQNIIAGITIPVAVYMMYLTVLLNGGFFFN
jgi:hypothetical protein